MGRWMAFRDEDVGFLMDEYLSWWFKTKRKIECFYGATGQFVVNSINEIDSPMDFSGCRDHCLSLLGSFERLSGHNIQIAKTIFRKLASWADLFDSVAGMLD